MSSACPRDAVRYRAGDTDDLPEGRGNGGSGATAVGGAATKRAVEKVIATGRALAARDARSQARGHRFRRWPVPAQGLQPFGRAHGCGAPCASRRIRQACARLASSCRPPSPFRTAATWWRSRSIPTPAWSRSQRYSIVEDIGNVLNPTLAHGQIQGGVAMGVGQALGEVIVYDAESGQLISGSFMDYQMPRADDVPSVAPGDARRADGRQSAGRQGRRRGGYRRLAGRHHQRRLRCAFAPGHPAYRDAGDARPRLGRDRECQGRRPDPARLSVLDQLEPQPHVPPGTARAAGFARGALARHRRGRRRRTDGAARRLRHLLYPARPDGSPDARARRLLRRRARGRRGRHRGGGRRHASGHAHAGAGAPRRWRSPTSETSIGRRSPAPSPPVRTAPASRSEACRRRSSR